MQASNVSTPALLEYLPPARSVAGLAWRFVPEVEQRPVLALHALVAAVGQVAHAVSDPGVALAKLNWWQNEISAAPVKGSQHPLLRAVVDSDATRSLDTRGFTALIGSVADELEAGPAQNLAAFRQREWRRGGDEGLLLCGLEAGHPLAENLRAAAAAAGMVDRLEALAARPCPGWLPLDLVARFQLQRSGPAAEVVAASPGLARELASAALQWWPEDAWPGLVEAPELCVSAPGRYWLLRARLARQRLVRWADSPVFWLQRVQAPVLAEVWQAWKLARWIYRPVALSR